MDKEFNLLHIIKQELLVVLLRYVKMEHIVLAEVIVELVLTMEELQLGYNKVGNKSSLINK